jgi:hypothetical protein
MRRLWFASSVLVIGLVTACLGSTTPSGPQAAIPYAVVYGHVGAPLLTTNINVIIWAYTDSAHALAGGDTGTFAGAVSQAVDTANNFVAVIPASAPRVYYLDVLATGQGRGGFVSSVDTIRGLRARFDSLNGGPHDSIDVYDSLP